MLAQAEDRLGPVMGQSGFLGTLTIFQMQLSLFVYLLKIVFQWVTHIYVHNVNTLNSLHAKIV